MLEDNLSRPMQYKLWKLETRMIKLWGLLRDECDRIDIDAGTKIKEEDIHNAEDAEAAYNRVKRGWGRAIKEAFDIDVSDVPVAQKLMVFCDLCIMYIKIYNEPPSIERDQQLCSMKNWYPFLKKIPIDFLTWTLLKSEEFDDN